ncbi:endonuclease V [Halobacteriales archaeon QS_1_68_20]|nr:MAG: endonuclease V [Halobacteriales archaeon QS_1_68_20]
MEVRRPEFVPDPALSREEMEALQRDIADAATFADDPDFDSATLIDREPGQSTLADASAGDAAAESASDTQHVVVGVDQAFFDDRALSAVVASRGGEVIDRAGAAVDVEIPYIPGLLSFREGGAILAALAELDVDPDLLVLDGSGRIHFRQAGIATHVGVVVDCPAVGVAKSLLCGRPTRSLEDPLPEGERVPIEADERVEAPARTVLGHAYQSRQYDSPNRHVNPLYVSPGHRVGVDTATDLVAALCAGYKLPEPTRLADSYADELKADHR